LQRSGIGFGAGAADFCSGAVLTVGRAIYAALPHLSPPFDAT